MTAPATPPNAPRSASSQPPPSTGGVDSLIRVVLENESLSCSEKKMLLDELRKLKPPLEDRWIFRWVIWILGAIALATVSAGLFASKPLTEGTLALASAAVGALAAFLSPSVKPK